MVRLDPYKSNDGWLARRPQQRKLPTKSAAEGTSDAETTPPPSAHRSRARAAEVDFPFGSPSKRFLFGSGDKSSVTAADFNEENEADDEADELDGAALTAS